MAQYWVDPENGDDGNAGTLAAPWKLIPGQTGANTVAANDIINVKNGATTSLRFAIPANGLTYRGYGVADNVLTLTLPAVGNPQNLVTHRVVREAGVHEGMWTLDATGIPDFSVVQFGTRTNCVLEDLNIINADATTTAISCGATSNSQVGATIRRCAVRGSAGRGITQYRPSTLIEDTLVEDTVSDGITFGTSEVQLDHAGYTTTYRRLSLINNGYSPTELGDAIQMSPSTNGFAGTFNIERVFVQRNNPVKQGIMLGTFTVGISITDSHFDGQAVGHIQIGMWAPLAGASITIDRNFFKVAETNTNAIVRFVDGAFGAGATVTITRNVVLAPLNAGLFTWGSSGADVAGDVVIRNNIIIGELLSGFSFSASVSAQTTATIEATASMTVENNAFVGVNYAAVRLPAGGLNSAQWVVRGNVADSTASAWAVGPATSETLYATATAFEAAHSHAAGNGDGPALVTETGRPLPGSPLLTSGADLGYVRDIEGKQSRKHIGAYGAAMFRTPY